jgi:hypothetical protein
MDAAAPNASVRIVLVAFAMSLADGARAFVVMLRVVTVEVRIKPAALRTRPSNTRLALVAVLMSDVGVSA